MVGGVLLRQRVGSCNLFAIQLAAFASSIELSTYLLAADEERDLEWRQALELLQSAHEPSPLGRAFGIVMLLLVSFICRATVVIFVGELTLGSLVTLGILNEARLRFLFAGRAPRLLRAGILRMLLVAIVIVLKKDIGGVGS